MNSTIKHKRELEQKLTPLLIKYLNNSTWPLENFQWVKKIKNYIKTSNYTLSIMSASKFIQTFSLNINDNFKVLAENYKNSKYFLNREKIKNVNNWSEILKEAELTMDSLLTKLWSVELISKSNNCKISGIDNFCFLTIPFNIKTKFTALKYFKNLLIKLKYYTSLSQSCINYMIKSKNFINSKIKKNYKTYLQNLERKLSKYRYKKIYYFFLQNPVKYLDNLRIKVIKNNIQLKLKIIKSLKTLKIKKSFVNSIFKMYTSKTISKLKFLYVSIIKNRTLQTLFKLTAEPYMEPLGDLSSFGFRPKKNYHQAVSYLFNKLSNQKKIKKSSIKNKKYFFISYYLLNANINSCFNNVSQKWLISNVPIPFKYQFILYQVFKKRETRIIIKNNKIILKNINNPCGILENNILSFLLINWALNGIENILFKTVNNIKDERIARVRLKATLWLIIRYANKCVIGIKNRIFLYQIKAQLKFFLKKRGFVLSNKKTKIIQYNLNAKISFLSWTFHYFMLKKLSCAIKSNKKLLSKFNNLFNLYVYPSNTAIFKLKCRIKQITKHLNSWKKKKKIIKAINSVLNKWSNYFFLVFKQSFIQLAINLYLFNRIKRYIFKKYKSSYFKFHIKLNQNKKK